MDMSCEQDLERIAKNSLCVPHVKICHPINWMMPPKQPKIGVAGQSFNIGELSLANKQMASVGVVACSCGTPA
jgi:hypothetical protein